MRFLLLPVALALGVVVWAQEAKPPAAPEVKPAQPAAQAATAEKPPEKPKSEVIAQATNRPDSGRVVNDIYTSDFFGFTLALPKGWKTEDQANLRKSVDESYQKLYGKDDPQAQAEAEAAEARAFLLLSAEGKIGEEAIASQVQIGAEELPPDAGVTTGKDYLDAVNAVPSDSALELKPLHPPAEVKLGGQSFWREDYGASTILNGKTVSISYAEYVSVQKGYALILSFWTDTPAHLAELVKYAASLAFTTTEAPAKRN